MCGILAVFNYKRAASPAELRLMLKSISKLQGHRGPDWSGVVIFDDGKCGMAHERLSIIGLSSGSQPMTSAHSPVTLCVNGEIYNYMNLKKTILANHHDGTFLTESDCEVILHLYEDMKTDLFEYIDGIFAFILFDGKNFLVARDHIGICPLYQGWGKEGSVWFASEMKCLQDHCERIVAFPPGHYYWSAEPSKGYVQYYKPKWYVDPEYIPTTPCNLDRLRNCFVDSVISQMMSEVPYGCLLSGGLDSSLVASIASEMLQKTRNQKLMTFSIGLPGAPDLIAARKVAEYLGTEHYEFNFTIQEGIDMLSDIIWHLETYDVTTIRASTPMFFLARHIKALGVKMVLSGEGSDEIFGGYLYFHKAPDAESLHKECVRRVKHLHLFDCLRANKSTMAWGVEARVPFLDRKFLDVVMEIDPKEKMSGPNRIEKYILRKAFDVNRLDGRAYLPAEVLWRQKEQFSDGVGYSWIDSLREFTEKSVSDDRFEHAKMIFPLDTPMSKEAFYYRQLFEALFPGAAAVTTVAHWIPRTDWGTSADPSGRAQGTHAAAYDNVKEGN